MGMEKRFDGVRLLVWTALLAALTAMGAYITFPLGPIPFSMQTFFVLLAGFALGSVRGAVCMLLYLAVGFMGLPVFSGGRGGLAHIFGPTGGFLAGFVVCAFVAGQARARRKGAFSFRRGVAWGVAATALLFVFGVARLKWVLDFDWAKAFAVGCLPFLPGAAVKIVMASAARLYLGRTGLMDP